MKLLGWLKKEGTQTQLTATKTLWLFLKENQTLTNQEFFYNEKQNNVAKNFNSFSLCFPLKNFYCYYIKCEKRKKFKLLITPLCFVKTKNDNDDNGLNYFEKNKNFAS